MRVHKFIMGAAALGLSLGVMSEVDVGAAYAQPTVALNATVLKITGDHKIGGKGKVVGQLRVNRVPVELTCDGKAGQSFVVRVTITQKTGVAKGEDTGLKCKKGAMTVNVDNVNVKLEPPAPQGYLTEAAKQVVVIDAYIGLNKPAKDAKPTVSMPFTVELLEF